jgi:hypothetical protein
MLLPGPRIVAKPLLLIMATAGDEEFQTTELVRSCVDPSLKYPVALNCCDAPMAVFGAEGVTVIDTSVLPGTTGGGEGGNEVGALTVTENTAAAVAADESVTVSLSTKVPACVGVPEITPMELIESPGASPEADHVYGPVPPIADTPVPM